MQDTGPRRAAVWLWAGVALLFASQVRLGIGMLAWIAPIPFLHYVRITTGRRSRLLLMGAILAGWHLTTAKIVTPPLTYLAVPLYAIPLAIFTAIPLLAWDFARTRMGEAIGIFFYASLVVVMEWLTYTSGLFGTWGALANTQSYNLPLIQLVSLGGITAVAFLMSWGAALGEAALASALPDWRRHAAVFGVVFLLVNAYGVLRLERRQPGPELRVAGIISEMMADGRLPEDAERHAGTDMLFARTARAAELGARLVVWNEAAMFVTRDEEPALLARATALARERSVEIVVAYAVMLDRKPLRYENKYVWLRADGSTAETYWKHFPVPGEPSVRGTSKLRLAGSALGPFAGAICYDYDFPPLARKHARLGAGLVVVPSSDWRGIDPIHSEIGKLRAIEGGFSLLRPVRASASGAWDAFGRPRATLDYFSANDRIIMAQLPVAPIPTLYSQIGDIGVLAAGLFAGAAIVKAFAKHSGGDS
jgi:apolipoprotein N-acyltransferase